jgi:hypothetical protein
MAHCPPALLADVARVLAEVRTWPGVIEKRPCIFYLRGQPFLHFHLLPGPRRRADVKGQRGWVQVELLPKMTERNRGALRRELRCRYDERVGRARTAAAPLSLAPHR